MLSAASPERLEVSGRPILAVRASTHTWSTHHLSWAAARTDPTRQFGNLVAGQGNQLCIPAARSPRPLIAPRPAPGPGPQSSSSRMAAERSWVSGERSLVSLVDVVPDDQDFSFSLRG